jgi:Zn-dependent peptidase ImmA (M78 family)/transcriptional regulator with XRE-family HTH domain
MTASALAERVGVSPGAISQHELHDAEPHAKTLSKVAEVLDLPETYFLRTGIPKDPAHHWYRSQSAATKKARESAQARHSWLREIVFQVQRKVDFPQNSIAAVKPPTDPLAISSNDIESMAADLRAEWKLGNGPISNAISLLETLGCIVGMFAFGADELSAFSQFASDRPYVILNAEESAAVRLRFNAAHELAHLVLHRNVPSQEASRPAIHKKLEQQAHRFAGAFLFPYRAFAEEVYSTSLDALEQVKKRWRVSMQMMIRRAYDLEMTSEDRYSRAFRELSRRGWRTKEPMDDSLPIEKPKMLAKSINLMIDNRVASREDLIHDIGLSQADIEILAALPHGFLKSEQWGEVSEIKLRSSLPSDTKATGSGAGQIIPFRIKT